MKHNIKHKALNLRIVSLLLSAIITVGCGRGGGSSSPIGGDSNDNFTLQNRAAAPLTIDNAGTYPVIEGNTERTASVWVHNNSDVAITDFSYTKTYNTNVDMSDKSPSGCSDIMTPRSSCMIRFEVPKLDAKHISAALNIKARYKIGNEYRNVDQVVNFAYVDATNAPATGVVSFSKNAVVNSLGNKEGYATLYIYGTGSRNTIYTINNLKLDNKGLNITNGDIVGKDMVGGAVVAVEVGGSLLAEQSFDTKLDIGSRFGDKSFDNSVNLSVDPVLSSANVVAGFQSIVDVSKKITGEIFIYNSGSRKAIVTGVTSTNTKLTIDRDSCGNGQELASGVSCAVKFMINDKGNGSANITIKYNEVGSDVLTSLVVTQNWFNSTNTTANMSLVADTSILNLIPKTPGKTTVTLTNSGNTQLTGIDVKTPNITNGATVTIEDNTCNNITLQSLQKCTYTLSVIDNNTTNNGNISSTVNANYIDSTGTNTPITTEIVINYKTSSFPTPIVSFSNQPTPMAIVGDGSESAIQTVNLSNIGNYPVTITNAEIVASNGSVPSYLNLESSACEILQKNESCTLTVRLGTATNDTDDAFTNSLKLKITTINNVFTSNDFTATVTPVSVNMSTARLTVSDGITGNGQSTTPYVINGSLTNDRTVTVTYTQQGSGQVRLVGVDALTGNNAMIWQLDDSSTCLNSVLNVAPNLTLKPSDKCTIVYKNVLGENSAGLSASPSITSNIKLPTLTLRTAGGNDFKVTPSFDSGDGNNKDTVYVRNSQALITNFISILNPHTMAQKLQVGSTVTNAVGYDALSVIAKIDKYPLLGLTPESQNLCTSIDSDAYLNQYHISCELPADKGNVSNTYDFDMNTLIALGTDYLDGTFVGEFDMKGINAPQWLFNAKDYHLLQIPASITTHISNFKIHESTITGLSDAGKNETTLVTPTNITTIAKDAFKGNAKLTSVIMPNVTTIGESAFQNNTALTTVIMPEVKTVGERAFHNNTALTTVIMPEVKTVDSLAFAGNKSLTSVNMPNVTTIGQQAFQENTALTSVDMPRVKTVDYAAFYLNTALTTVIMPEVETIGASAFQENTALTSVDTPMLKTLKNQAFMQTPLINVDMPNVKTVGNFAFRDNHKLKSVNMPNVETIGSYAFLNCTAIKSVILPSKELCENVVFNTNKNPCRQPSLARASDRLINN